MSLFVGFSGIAYWRLHRRILRTRFVVLTLMLGPLSGAEQYAPVWPLVIVAVALSVIVLIEARQDAPHLHPREAPA